MLNKLGLAFVGVVACLFFYFATRSTLAMPTSNDVEYFSKLTFTTPFAALSAAFFGFTIYHAAGFALTAYKALRAWEPF